MFILREFYQFFINYCLPGCYCWQIIHDIHIQNIVLWSNSNLQDWKMHTRHSKRFIGMYLQAWKPNRYEYCKIRWNGPAVYKLILSQTEDGETDGRMTRHACIQDNMKTYSNASDILLFVVVLNSVYCSTDQRRGRWEFWTRLQTLYV